MHFSKKNFFMLKKSKYFKTFQNLADLEAIKKGQTTPRIEKNKLLFNEYLGNFRPCFYFFYGE